MFCRSFWRFFTILHNWFNSLTSLIVLPCIVRKESNNSMVSLLYLTCKCATACFIFSVLSHFQSALELLCLWIWGVLYVVYYSTYNGCRLLYKFPATFKTKFSLIIKTIDQCTLAVTEKKTLIISCHCIWFQGSVFPERCTLVTLGGLNIILLLIYKFWLTTT